MVIPGSEMLVRLGASIALGGVVGYDRERLGRPAGLRTHLLVSLASATFMLVSTQFVYYQLYGRDDLVVVDASRIAASVVAGVGFLGAGAILRTGLGVQGLTTAASLWTVASIGLASGAGMYAVALATTIATFACLVVLRAVERRRRLQPLHRVVVVVAGDTSQAAAVASLLEQHGALATGIDQDHHLRTHRTRLSTEVRLSSPEALREMIGALEALPNILRVKVEHAG